MSSSTTVFKIFLASPGDTQQERKSVEKIVSEINSAIGDYHNFIVRVLTWENDSYPDFGVDGQDVINRELGMDYDIFVGIMWKKFGTKTGRADSGTEEEFDRAYDRVKKGEDVKILFYFNSADIPQAELDLTQFEKVKNFKRKVNDLGGYYWSYNSIENFEKDFRKHLQKHLLSLVSKSESKTGAADEINEIALVPQISEEFNDFLDDTEAIYAHSEVDEIRLPDIYIAPDLKYLNHIKSGATFKVINLEKLTNAIDVGGLKFGLIGNESAGKTTNCKYIFKKYFNAGLLPVYIKGTDFSNNIRTEAILKLVQEKIYEQYEFSFLIKDFPRDKFLIIIDDFHKSAKGNNRYWPTLIKNIEAEFQHLIITGNNLMPLENVAKEDAFQNFELFALLEFGPKLRSELVERWYTLGGEKKFVDKNELLRKHDNAIEQIKTIIGRNYIPSFPFYLLSILQAMESANVQNPNYSIHGFYYELLINDALTKSVRDKKEISFYFNYLTYLCYFLFERNTKSISISDLREFHTAYCSKHDLSYSFDLLIRTLETARFLNVNQRVEIKEAFVYYFFVAKYISHNILKPEIRELVTKMSLRIFKDEYASIVMFVTHLSKDEFIIQELIKNADSIFEESSRAKLEDDIVGINNLITDLPKQVLELVDVDQKRTEELEEQEDAERKQKEDEFDREPKNYDGFELDDDISTIDFYAKITLALKTIDILGQVTKKHWGDIDGVQKLNLVNATYNLGLRMLSTYLNYVQSSSSEITEHIKDIVVEKHITDRFELKEKIEEASRDFIFKLCFISSWGISKRISNAIGYDKLKNSFEKALDAQPTNAVKLIDLSIKLGYAGIPMREIERYSKEMKKSNLSFVLLQNLVIDHMYMFDTDFNIKNQVCAALNISMKDQRTIDLLSTIKKDN